MAEEYLNHLSGGTLQAESAGLEPGVINPYVQKVLLEDDIDIREKKTTSVFDLFREGRRYEYVITVCSREAEERCPLFPGVSKRLNWPLPDPSALTGSEEEILDKVRGIRDTIKERVLSFIEEYEHQA